VLGAAILVETTGLLFFPENPWVSIIAAPFVLVSILGWALEDPMGHATGAGEHVQKPRTVPSAREIVDMANAAVERVVTFGSTAYSTHPITVEIEEDHGKDGVVLTIYGKVELGTQRQEIQEALESIYGVISVKNFVVAEDDILNL